MSLNLEQELNSEQIRAVTYGSGPLLILAGAGSGKTRALTYRAAYLIRDQKNPAESILLLTFTNKAAGEMQRRLEKLVDASLPFAGTFHSFCAKILRRYGHHLGLPTNFLIYDDADQLDLVKQVIKELDLNPKDFKPRPILSQIGSAKNELMTPANYATMARGLFQETVAEVYQRYQERLKQNEAVDFDDLLLLTVRLLQTQPLVLAKLQKQFSYILVDEYQDTNRAQYLIAKLLAAKHRNLNAVGDASQSIYRWRGADYRNLDYLKQDFPELAIIKLEQNYRSSQVILDAATSVIRHNTSHPILGLWTENKGGELIRLYQAEDQNDEASYVLSQLKPANGQTAVLYRTNAQSRAFEEVFIRSGVSYALVGGVKFYQRQEIKDVLAYMRVMVSPKDQVSYARAEKLGKRRLANLEALRSRVDAKNLTTTELFERIFQATGYLDKYDKNDQDDLHRLENIQELLSVATKFDDPVAFLENVALVEDNTLDQAQATFTSEPPSVTLMTIHSAKGLEFDQVFVVGLEEGLFPHSRSLLDSVELEEERRLCYVALTRAKNRLHLTYARNRVYFGGGGSGIASRFISDIPEQYLHLPSLSLTYTRPTPRTSTYLSDDLLDDFLEGKIDADQILR